MRDQSVETIELGHVGFGWCDQATMFLWEGGLGVLVLVPPPTSSHSNLAPRVRILMSRVNNQQHCHRQHLAVALVGTGYDPFKARFGPGSSVAGFLLAIGYSGSRSFPAERRLCDSETETSC
jgi:hypothetical protein